MNRAALAAVVVIVVALTPACADAALQATCVDDQACPEGTVCAFGLCADPSALGVVDIEVEPVVASGLPTQSIFAVDTVTETRVDVTLAEAVNVSGGVVAASGGGLGATVTAVPDREIAGRRRQPTTTTADGPFGLSLVAGESYRLQAVPTERDLPPIFADQAFVAGSDGTPSLVMTSERTASGPIHPITLKGQVVAGVGVAAQPISELELFLLDDRGRRVSSLGVSDAEGHFEIGLAARHDDVRFVARRSERNALSPTLAFPLDLGTESVVDLGVLSLGASLGIVRVEGEVRSFSGAPLTDAVVAFRGLVGAGIAEARTVTTDGRFSVSLHPGSYSVAAVGAVGGPDGLLVTTLEVAQDLRDVVLTVPERVPAGFDIVTSTGQPVDLASVVLTRVGDENGLAEPVLGVAQPVFLGSTDDDGHAGFSVDPGRYRIAIQPPRGVEAPTFSTLITVIEAADRTITLPASTVVPGTLRTGAGDPVVGAFVRVYSSLTDELGRAIFLGEGLSNADGTFDVIVPLQ